LSYCNLIWACDSSSVRLDRILKIPKKYVRIITFSDFGANSKPLFKKLSILTVYDLYKYQLAIFMFKNFNGLIPATHRFMFKLNSDLHSYKTRNSLKYHVSYCRTSCRQNVAQNLGPRLWNSLPQDIVTMRSLNHFKIYVKQFLLSWFWICLFPIVGVLQCLCFHVSFCSVVPFMYRL